MDAENNDNTPAIALPLFHEDIYTGMRACLCIICIEWEAYIYTHIYTYQPTNTDLYNICSVWIICKCTNMHICIYICHSTQIY